MGLESINYFFKAKESVLPILNSSGLTQSKFFLQRENCYYIDFDLIDTYTLSIRVPLYNPKDKVLVKLFELISSLFKLKESTLTDMNSKKKYFEWTDIAMKELAESFSSKKEVFQSMYGNFTATISSEEFYRVIEQNSKT